MTRDMKISSHPWRDPQTIQRAISHVHDLTTSETDEVMVYGHVGIEARAVVPVVHLTDQSGLLQHPKGVVDCVWRDQGETSTDLPMEILSRGMVDALGERLVNSGSLRRYLHTASPKSSLYLSGSEFHAVFC
jgi:hypothetical protein